MAEAKKLMAAMPADRKPAFFQLVQYPVDAAGNTNIRQLALDKTITYGLQRRESANSYAAEAKRAQTASMPTRISTMTSCCAENGAA
jgi:hypothetical protein